jgi:hypothetical protein
MLTLKQSFQIPNRTFSTEGPFSPPSPKRHVFLWPHPQSGRQSRFCDQKLFLRPVQ